MLQETYSKLCLANHFFKLYTHGNTDLLNSSFRSSRSTSGDFPSNTLTVSSKEYSQPRTVYAVAALTPYWRPKLLCDFITDSVRVNHGKHDAPYTCSKTNCLELEICTENILGQQWQFFWKTFLNKGFSLYVLFDVVFHWFHHYRKLYIQLGSYFSNTMNNTGFGRETGKFVKTLKIFSY